MVNKWGEIVESLGSSKIIYFKRCYYLYDIVDPMEKYHLRGFSNVSNSAYAVVVFIKTVAILEYSYYICHFKVENSSLEQI